MKIRISNLKLKNFKGQKNLEIDFNCKNTNIYGKNAIGKTTIFDAFKWLFFDKDSDNRTKFNVKPLSEDNKIIHFLETEVEATLNVDGVNMKFKKVLKENWVKKRGQEEQEMSNNTNRYWIDDVPVQQKDYKEKVNSLIPETLFKLITDPKYFSLNMNDEERKKILYKISSADNITDEDILNSDPKFTILQESLNGKTIEDYTKIIKESVDLTKKEISTIPIRIDELTNTLVTEHDINYEEIEKQKEEYNQELQKIEMEMTNVQAKAMENMKLADQLAIKKKELTDFKLSKETEYSQKYSTELINLQNEKRIIESTIRVKQEDDDERKLKMEQDHRRKDELYKKWDEVNNTKLEFDPNSFICPTCKREYETDKIEEMKKTFENNFNIHKEGEKETINKEGQAINIRLDENKQARERLQQEIKETNDKLIKIDNKIAELEKTKENEGPFDINSVPEYSDKVKEIEKLEEKVSNLTNGDISIFQNQKAKIIEEINKLNKTLNEREMQERTQERIEELQIEEKENAQKIQELESKLFLIEEFNKAKTERLETTINNKFEHVKFKLLEEQINGGIKQVCQATLNGVPYSDLNNAHKILVGLDIINTLIKFYDKSAPIFIDNRESINEIYNIDTQIISLIVTTDKELRIEVM